MNPSPIVPQISSAHWQKIGTKPHHGILVPLFSIRSQDSTGFGEYLDLLPLLKWCKEIGFNIVQLLPINDSGRDSSPYSALSSVALNPIYLSLSKLPFVSESKELEKQLQELKKYNLISRPSYLEVFDAKYAFLKHYTELYFSRFEKDTSYQAFITNNPAMKGHALFKALKRKFNWTKFQSWPSEFKNLTSSQVETLLLDHQKDAQVELLSQYFSDMQMNQVKKEAEANGIFLKGDVPISISNDSTSVWMHHEIFNLEFEAGAPPDYYNTDGQKWGLPVYEWDRHEEKVLHWWKARLDGLAKYFHLYRIDHIVGLFRIWSVPLEKKAKEGHFIPPEEEKWFPQGKKILEWMLNHCSLLPIGEDLGTVPAEVRSIMLSLGIPGTKVTRWERAWNQENKPFLKPEEYPPLSLSCTGTHDTPSLAEWWSSFPEESKELALERQWPYEPVLSTEIRRKLLNESHRAKSIFHINLLTEYLNLFPELAWETPQEDRINIPGVVNSTNWVFRFKPTVEEIVAHPGLKNEMQCFTNQAS